MPCPALHHYSIACDTGSLCQHFTSIPRVCRAGTSGVSQSPPRSQMGRIGDAKMGYATKAVEEFVSKNAVLGDIRGQRSVHGSAASEWNGSKSELCSSGWRRSSMWKLWDHGGIHSRHFICRETTARSQRSRCNRSNVLVGSVTSSST
jgi:hypothetical protein